MQNVGSAMAVYAAQRQTSADAAYAESALFLRCFCAARRYGPLQRPMSHGVKTETRTQGSRRSALYALKGDQNYE